MHGRGSMRDRSGVQERWPLKRAVPILMECIFVKKIIRTCDLLYARDQGVTTAPAREDV